MDDGGDEEEKWVRFQEEHLVKENYCLSIWVVSKFVNSFKVITVQHNVFVSWMVYT